MALADGARIAPSGPAPILDVCTGTGDLALAYWNAGGRIRVFGTDFTHEMLQIAGRKVSAIKQEDMPAGIVFAEADTLQLPFADDQFQIVSVAFGLRNVADTQRGLAEMIRVAQPSGRVVVLEFSEPGNRLFRRAYQAYFRHVLPRVGQLVARNQEDAYNYLPSSVAGFPQGPALVELMDACGLEQVVHRPLTGGIATLYYGCKPVSKQSSTCSHEFEVTSAAR